MLLNVKDTDVNYVRYGKENSQAIVYLHGWGQNIQMMKPVEIGRASCRERV